METIMEIILTLFVMADTAALPGWKVASTFLIKENEDVSSALVSKLTQEQSTCGVTCMV